MKSCNYKILNEAVYVGFLSQREKGDPLSEPTVKEKAKILAYKLRDSYKIFCVSSSWLDG